MNFKKLMIVVAVAVVAIAAWKYVGRVDRSNPVAVATAFTKAIRSNDTSTASKFYVPDQADAWRQKLDENMQSMRSNAMEMRLEHIPSSPAFTPPVTAAGKTMIVSADKTFSLEMKEIAGKWYVAKTDFE